MTTVLLCGYRGWIGSQICAHYKGHKSIKIIPVSTDIASPALVRAMLEDHAPDVVLNAAGYTDFNECEKHKNKCFRSNLIGPLVLAGATNERKIRFINIGTGCIFNGYEKQWSTADLPNFVESVYGKAKAAADIALRAYPNTTQLRIRLPMSTVPHSKNLIDKAISFLHVHSWPNSVTLLDDFIPALEPFFTRQEDCGIYNMVNPGLVTMQGIVALWETYIDGNHYHIPIGNKNPPEEKIPRSHCILADPHPSLRVLDTGAIREILQVYVSSNNAS
jgi:dTDP-4-dehydrorhamnose reductase